LDASGFITPSVTTSICICRLAHSGTASPEEELREEPVLSSESEPQVSERAAVYGDSPVFGSPSDPFRKVQFQIGMPFDMYSYVYRFS
jgi:hypothetical protein